MKKRLLSLLLAIVLLVCVFPGTASAAGSLSNFSKVNTYTMGQFTDVKDQWFASYVQTAYEYGLINGSSATTFSPENNLTIAEAIKLAACLHSIYNTGTASFSAGSPWYQPYVDYALQNGIISAAYANYSTPASRADFALIFSKALPDEALSVINTIGPNAIPDVMSSYSYAAAVYKLYKAGILTGSDSAGNFFPNSFITRDAVAAIVTRMAIASYRQKLTLSVKEMTAAEISTQFSPAVFYIDLLSKAGTTIRSGSGFFISDTGLAVTNYHVVQDMIDAKIKTKDGNTYNILGIVDYSEENDLAIIKIEGSGFPYLMLGDSAAAVTGSNIYAIGYPLGLDQTITPGVITNASHTVDNMKYLMINASISPGSSGGALLDSTGAVIGVTTAYYSEGQNLNLAVPINQLSSLSRDKEPVALSVMFAKDYTYYTRYTNIPDFASVTGCTMYDQYYSIETQSQYYLYETRSLTDDIYDMIEPYLDQLDIAGCEYLGWTEIEEEYFYVFNDPTGEWTVAVGTLNLRGTKYIEVVIYKATEEADK
jgi:S1-C subfamily serine protease